MSAQAPLLVRIRPRWVPLSNQAAWQLPGRSVEHISILSQPFNQIGSTFRDPGSNVGIVAPTLGVAPAGPGRQRQFTVQFPASVGIWQVSTLTCPMSTAG